MNMNITVNGKTREVATALTLPELLCHMGLSQARVVVERNGEIVDQPGYATVVLQEHDTLEILGFVGGG